jgi:hypothetical protein
LFNLTFATLKSHEWKRVVGIALFWLFFCGQIQSLDHKKQAHFFFLKIGGEGHTRDVTFTKGFCCRPCLPRQWYCV